ASANNLPFGTNLLLGPLADNGGRTQTHALRAGSPAIDAGSNPAGLTTDQRGPGFVRTFGFTDIGAYEFISDTPVAVGPFPDVTTPGAVSQTIRVTYFDNVAIFAATIGAGDVRVTGPNGFNVVATWISVDVGTSG